MIPNSGNDKQSFPMDNSILHRITPGPSRVLVGVNQFNDENQQNLRIQQAVNRYNGTGLPPNWRPSATFKCNLFKGKTLKPFSTDDNVSCEDPKQKPETRYASPGHFPTVLLGKSQMRPSTKQSILSQLRANASGLPVSRFLDDSAEKYSDIKPTRSVLEVLQDLSRKRIHGKDDSEELSKRRCKGLGGDLIAEGEIPFQPLFVSKIKNQIFPKKDQMTQTLSDLNLSDANKPSSVHDSKWELRKKLAQKNNEIFASLSSSIASTFFAKRKRVSNSNIPDGDEKSIKKKKVEKPVENSGDSKLLDFEKKAIKKEHGPRSPPTKDRLMNIYFDLQNNSNVKGDVLKAMNSESAPSQFKRTVAKDDNDITTAVIDSITKTVNLTTTNSTNEKLGVEHKPLIETSTVPSSSNLQILFTEKSSTPITFDTKKANELVIEPCAPPSAKLETKSEHLNSPGFVTTTPGFSLTNTTTFASSTLTPLQKDTPLVNSTTSPKINLESVQSKLISNVANPEVGSSPSAAFRNEHSTGFQLVQKDYTSPTSIKDSFKIEAVKNTSFNSLNAGISDSKIVNTTSSHGGINPIADTKLGFSFGDSKVALNTPNFSFNPTKNESSPSSSTSQFNTSVANVSPSKLSEKPSNPLTTLASIIEPLSGNSLLSKKTADTTSTFSFGNLKPNSSASVAPSLFTSIPQKSSHCNQPEITSLSSSSSPTPVFSFGQSSPGFGSKPGFFSFGSDSQAARHKETNADAKTNATNTVNEGFSFENSVKPIGTLRSGSDEHRSSQLDASIIKDKTPPGTSGFFSTGEISKGPLMTASTVPDEKDNASLFMNKKKIPSIFARLGSATENYSANENIAPTNFSKHEETKQEIVGDAKQVNRTVFQPSNESNLFKVGPLFGSDFTTKSDIIVTTQSAPLFSQTNSPITSSSVFSFKSNDQPTFKFGPSTGATDVSLSTEAKPFVFGPMTNTASIGEAKPDVKVNDIISTATKTSASSIFSFGPEKPSEITSNFTFGKLPTSSSTQPFAFGKSQGDTVISNITSSSPFSSSIPTNTSKTTEGFGSLPSSQTLGGNQTPATVPATVTPAFGAATSTFSFGSTTTNPSPFGTLSNNLFGATTTANSVFGPTTPAFGNTTTAPPSYDSVTTFNTTASAPMTFGGGTTFGATTSSTVTFGGTNASFPATSSAPTTFGSATTFNTATTAPLTFGSGTTFGATSSTPATFGNGTTFGATSSAPTFGNPNTFGSTTSASSGFGNTTFGSNTTAPAAFGGSTAFVTTTSTPVTFGTLTSFGSSASTNAPSNVPSGFGNPTGTAAFGNSSAPFANSSNAFSPAFGNTGSSFNSSTPTFGNTVAGSTFANDPPPFSSNPAFGNGNTPGNNNNAAFGSNPSSATTTSATPFGNSNPTSPPFGFGAASTTTNSSAPSFNFGSTSTSASQANNSFNFGSAGTSGSSGSSVFNFGGNTATNNSKPFCFGTNTSGLSGYSLPTPGPSGFPSGSTTFNLAPNQSPSTSFSLPGTFSIGSGSAQPRSRSVSRFRRRT